MPRTKIEAREIATLDTGVLIRWIELADDPDGICKAAVEKARETHRIAIPAPAFAEVRRCHDAKKLPRLNGLQVLPFDRESAALLGERLPHGRIIELAAPGYRGHVKFDAQIIACASRHRASIHLAIDHLHFQLAARCGLRCESPEKYVHGTQTSLDLDG